MRLTIETLSMAANMIPKRNNEAANKAQTRERRDIASALKTKSSVGDGARKPRWRAQVKPRAVNAVRDALA